MNTKSIEVEGRWYESINPTTMTITVRFFNKNEEIVAKFPFRYSICGLCGGLGTHVNPNIDNDGIVAATLHNDPDFAESYFNGVYDVACYECSGSNIVPIIDPIDYRLDKALYVRYQDYLEEERGFRMIIEGESKAGC